MAQRLTLDMEKELFPNCIQAPKTYANKRKSSVLPDLQLIHGSTPKARTMEKQEVFKNVEEWLDKSSKMQTPVPRTRRPFGEINVNTERLNRNNVLKNQNSFKNVNKIVQEHKKSDGFTKKKSFIYTKRINTKIAQNTGDYIDSDEIVLIDDSPHSQTLDKDREALREVERCAKLESCESVNFNEIDDDVLVLDPKTDTVSGCEHKCLLPIVNNSASPRSENVFKSDDENVSNSSKTIQSNKSVQNNYSVSNNVPFFKLGSLSAEKLDLTEKPVIVNDTNTILIKIESNQLIANIKIMKKDEKKEEPNRSYTDKGIQTISNASPIKSTPINRGTPSKLYKSARKSLFGSPKRKYDNSSKISNINGASENVFIVPDSENKILLSKENSPSNSSSGGNESVQKSSGKLLVEADVHNISGPYFEQSSDESFVEGTPEKKSKVLINHSNNPSSLEKHSERTPKRRPEPCFRRLSGSCHSSCSSNKENTNPNYFTGPDVDKKETSLLKRVPFGVICENELERLNILCSGLDHAKVVKVKKMCQIMRWNHVEQFDDHVTHLICHVDEFNMTQRTVKYLMALAAGKWIVSFDWVIATLENSFHIEEVDFEVLDSSGTCAPMISRSVNNKIFQGLSFYCLPTLHVMNLCDLEVILKSAGGNVLHELKETNDEKLIILLAEKTNANKKICEVLAVNHRVLPLSVEWIAESLGNNKLQNNNDMFISDKLSKPWSELFL